MSLMIRGAALYGGEACLLPQQLLIYRQIPTIYLLVVRHDLCSSLRHLILISGILSARLISLHFEINIIKIFKGRIS